MKLKPATRAQVGAAQRAVWALENARDLLVEAECPKAAAAVRRALKSAQGALNHASRRMGATPQVRIELSLPEVQERLNNFARKRDRVQDHLEAGAR